MTLRKFSIAVLIFALLLIGAYFVSPLSPLFRGQIVISQSTQVVNTSVGSFITTDATGVVASGGETLIHVYAKAPTEVFVLSAKILFDPEYLSIASGDIVLSSDFSIIVQPKNVTGNTISFSVANALPVSLSPQRPVATIRAKTLKTGVTGVRVVLSEPGASSIWGVDYPSRNFLLAAQESPIGTLTIAQPVSTTVGGGGGGGGGGSATGGGAVVQPQTEGPCFPDTKNHPYGEESFCIVKRAGIFIGYPDGSFGASDNIDRAQMATVLARSIMTEDQISALFDQVAHGAAALFPDVVQTQWYAKYILAARQLGLVQGHEDGNYRPSDNVNYVEAVKMIVSFAAQKNPEIKATLDEELKIQRGAWYIPYVRVAQIFELLDGQPMSLLRANPAGLAKREWVAYVVSKIPGL